MPNNQEATIDEQEFKDQLWTKVNAKQSISCMNHCMVFVIYVLFFFFVLTLLILSLGITHEKQCQIYSIMNTIDPNSVEVISGTSYLYYECLEDRIPIRKQCKNSFDYDHTKTITLYSKDTECDCDFRMTEETVCSYKSSYIRATIGLAITTGFFLLLIPLLIIMKKGYNAVYDSSLDVVLKYKI